MQFHRKYDCSQHRILPILISPNQGQEQHFIENLSLAQELSHEMNRKWLKVLIKLDMTKAYDRLEWPFLFEVLARFGFSERWISYVRSMFTNCLFSVLYNGSVHGQIITGTKAGFPAGKKCFHHS